MCAAISGFNKSLVFILGSYFLCVYFCTARNNRAATKTHGGAALCNALSSVCTRGSSFLGSFQLGERAVCGSVHVQRENPGFVILNPTSTAVFVTRDWTLAA